MLRVILNLTTTFKLNINAHLLKDACQLVMLSEGRSALLRFDFAKFDIGRSQLLDFFRVKVGHSDSSIAAY